MASDLDEWDEVLPPDLREGDWLFAQNEGYKDALRDVMWTLEDAAESRKAAAITSTIVCCMGLAGTSYRIFTDGQNQGAMALVLWISFFFGIISSVTIWISIRFQIKRIERASRAIDYGRISALNYLKYQPW